MCVTHAARCWRARLSRPTDAIIWLTIFVLAAFVGIEVISKVSSTLHTPLMSGANAIHGVILSARSWWPGSATVDADPGPRLVAVVLAAINMVGGFVVTDRMLQMFSRPKGHRAAVQRRSSGDPVWAQLAYLVAAVCFIVALKGLSSPGTRAAAT